VSRRHATTAAAATTLVISLATPAAASFHFASISEVLTSLGGSSDVQFVEIVQNAPGQQFISGTKINVFDAQGEFVATVLTVDRNVSGGAGRPWLAGTASFSATASLPVDFVIAEGSLPTGGGMICWGMPGNSPTPVGCPGSGFPYVDCIAYGTYSGPANSCIGQPTPLAPDGHSLRRTSATGSNLADFECADPAVPENNTPASTELAATTACPSATTTSTTTSTSTTSTIGSPTTTTLAGAECGDANGDGQLTASDALVALRAAVGTGTCAASVCDVDASGAVTASDALQILRAAVGQPVELACG